MDKNGKSAGGGAIQEEVAGAKPVTTSSNEGVVSAAGDPLAPSNASKAAIQAAKLIHIWVRGSANLRDLRFRMKVTSRLVVLFHSYSLNVDQPRQRLRFMFDGRVIDEDDTPLTLEMEENDVIEVHLREVPQTPPEYEETVD